MKWIRRLKISWILAMIIVIGCLLGANQVLHAPRGPDGTGREAAAPHGDAKNGARGSGIVCTGVYGPESDIIPLVPSVKGEVMEVLVKSHQKVAKGQALLKMDDRLWRLKLEEAEAGVEFARSQQNQAQMGMKQYIAEREAQLLLIEIRKKEHAMAREKLAKIEPAALQKLSAAVISDYNAGKIGLEALDLAIKAEEKKLEAVEARKPSPAIEQADVGMRRAMSVRKQAQLGVDQCILTAPDDGVIMQVLAPVGTKFGEQGLKPAFLFYSGNLIVKADINQEWANRVAVGQTAVIQDHSGNGQTWRGKVTYVAPGFLPKREASAIPDILQQNQELVLECRITLDPNQKVPLLNQKVRVHLGN